MGDVADEMMEQEQERWEEHVMGVCNPDACAYCYAMDQYRERLRDELEDLDESSFEPAGPDPFDGIEP